MRGISFPSASASRRVDGDAYVATQPPKDINAADAVVMKVRGDCTRYGKSICFSISARSAAVFFAPHAVSIKSNSSPSRTMRPLDG